MVHRIGLAGGEVERTIYIPTGKRLFIPLYNVEFSTIKGNGVGEQLKDGVKSNMDYLDPESLSAMIGGSSIEKRNFYTAPSDLFEFGPLPDNNVLQKTFNIDAPAGTVSQSAADGYYMMLNPLPPGKHSIHWESTWSDNSNTFNQNVDYTVHVVPKGKGG